MRQPDRQRFLNAVRHVEVQEVPLVEFDPDITLINRMLGKEFPLHLHAYELPVQDHVDLCRVMGTDMMQFADIWRLGRKEKTDTDGRIHYLDGIMKTRESLTDIWFPDLDEVEKRLESTLAGIDGTGLGLICSNKCAPSIVSTAVGIQDYWIAALQDPGFIHEFQKRVHEYCLSELELFARYHVDAIGLGMFIGMKSGPMCSQAIREELVYPYLREQIGVVKASGIVTQMHVDGNVTTMMDEFIELGFDLLHPVEPCDGAQDIYELNETYGDSISFHGNIDVSGVLLNGTPEEVRQDTVEHMEKLGASGYVVGSSHDLNDRIPLENLFAMRDAVHEFTDRR